MRRLRSALSALRDDERGSAVVEFLGVSLLLLVPLVYLVLTLGRIQAAAFAAESAAREAGRIAGQAQDIGEARGRAAMATELAFSDHGISVDGHTAVRFTCEETTCASPGSQIHVTVRAAVRLPLVPDAVGGGVPIHVPVEAEYVATVPAFREVP